MPKAAEWRQRWLSRSAPIGCRIIFWDPGAQFCMHCNRFESYTHAVWGCHRMKQIWALLESECKLHWPQCSIKIQNAITGSVPFGMQSKSAKTAWRLLHSTALHTTLSTDAQARWFGEDLLHSEAATQKICSSIYSIVKASYKAKQVIAVHDKCSTKHRASSRLKTIIKVANIIGKFCKQPICLMH